MSTQSRPRPGTPEMTVRPPFLPGFWEKRMYGSFYYEAGRRFNRAKQGKRRYASLSPVR